MSPEKSAVGQRTVFQVGSITLEGNLSLPEQAQAMVLFAHGSGSSRFSSRNNFVAEKLNERSLATFLIDLLTSEEEEIDQRTRELRFDIDTLAERLVGAIDWLANEASTKHLPIGLFGASTGAAAALIAETQRPDQVYAVVSRGGRPDMAEEALGKVKSPTLLIVGGLDHQVIDLNKSAQRQMRAENELRFVEGATHLFEEPGALEQVAKYAGEWFQQHRPK